MFNNLILHIKYFFLKSEKSLGSHIQKIVIRSQYEVIPHQIWKENKQICPPKEQKPTEGVKAALHLIVGQEIELSFDHFLLW